MEEDEEALELELEREGRGCCWGLFPWKSRSFLGQYYSLRRYCKSVLYSEVINGSRME